MSGIDVSMSDEEEEDDDWSSTSTPPPPFSASNPRPDVPRDAAIQALRTLILARLQHVGFHAAKQDVVDELQAITFELLESILIHANQLAQHARRTGPNLKDIVRSSEELGIGGTQQLLEEISSQNKDKLNQFPIPETTFNYTKKRKEVVENTLGSDDEEDDDALAASKRLKEVLVADFLPPLPSKHSYKQTPVFPKSSTSAPVPSPSLPLQAPSAAASAHIATLRSRLADGQVVARSLRNLVRATGGGGGGGSGTVTIVGGGAGQEEESLADVVDFERDWYQPRGVVGQGGKRRIGIIRVGAKSVRDADVPDDANVIDPNANRGGVGKGGGPKRRRWRI
ncbi:hypothetical protein T439DRAFT_379008 [Meredithblackwellia eburnea MCA 4105]